MASLTGCAGGEHELAEALRRFAACGCDETVLIPTSSDLGQLRAAAAVAADVSAGYGHHRDDGDGPGARLK